MTSFVAIDLSNFANFVEHNISYQPCKIQLSGMSGSNFSEGVEKPLNAVPGEKSPVLLGLNLANALETLPQNLLLCDLITVLARFQNNC